MQLRTAVRAIARTIVPVALAAFIAAGCGGSNGVLGIGGIPSDSFCSVNGTGLKTKDFDNLVTSAKQQYKDNKRDFPKTGTAEYKELRSQAVEYLINREIISQQAKKRGITISDAKINKDLKALKKQYFEGDDKKFRAELKRTGYTEARVKSDLKDKAISDKLYKEITKDVKVSTADEKKYFEDNSDQFETKKSRDVAHILVKDKATADKIYAQVKGGDQKLFAKLAKQYTQDPGSKTTGGVLTGGVQEGQTVPEFDKTVFSLKDDETSKPVKTSFGWHVIQARGPIKPAKKQSFDEVQSQIKKQLQSAQESERFQQWQDDVRKDAEKDVDCKKGYVWTQTVKTKSTDAPAATAPSSSAGSETTTAPASASDDATTATAETSTAPADTKTDTTGK